jgi:hypothetical protein
VITDQLEGIRAYLAKNKNLLWFRVDTFLSVIESQLRELNDRFDEVTIYLLLCMALVNSID